MTPLEAVKVKALGRLGVGATDISRLLGIPTWTVRDAVNGKTWKRYEHAADVTVKVGERHAAEEIRTAKARQIAELSAWDVNYALRKDAEARALHAEQ